MQLKLKVIGGKNDGREIEIKTAEFIIGRGDEAHLRPSSDLVSRRHCLICLRDGKVVVEDLGSSNGTFVNGEKLTEPYEAKVGDILRVGRLQFQLLIDHVQPGAKRPKVTGVVEAAARAATAPHSDADLDEESISAWLMDSPPDRAAARLMTDTRQFTLDESQTRLFTKSQQLADEKVKAKAEAGSDAEGKNGESDSGVIRKKKQKPGKLPPRPRYSSESTTTAADEVLRRFFNRR